MKKTSKIITAAVCAAVMLNSAAVTASAVWKDTEVGKVFYTVDNIRTGFRKIENNDKIQVFW